MNENEFQIGGRKFSLSKIDAMKQFHIVRRVGPLLAELAPAFAGIARTKTDAMSEEEKFSEFAKLLQPFTTGLSKLSDADADYVLFRLLSSVQVWQDQYNTWAKISTDSGLMIQDLELPVLVQAAGRALIYNIGGFFASLPAPRK